MIWAKTTVEQKLRRKVSARRYRQKYPEKDRLRKIRWKTTNPEKYRKSVKDYYERNKELIKAKQRAGGKKRRVELTAFLNKYKGDYGCKICKNKDFRCLLFHHKNPTEKEFDISRKHNKKAVLKEIAKCDVLCANCHFILHYEENVKSALAV